MNTIRKSLAVGYDCLASWSDLLDRINVFPVADGDTGANLRISLAPFRSTAVPLETLQAQLRRVATGNSGNIAAAFFLHFCHAEQVEQLALQARLGLEMAEKSIAAPLPGTMLDVFATTARLLENQNVDDAAGHSQFLNELEQTVLATAEQLPEMQKAGVVDSGALAMFIFFEGFFTRLVGESFTESSIIKRFADRLAVDGAYLPRETENYCVDAVVELQGGQVPEQTTFADFGESLVMLQDADHLKIHLHTKDPEIFQKQLASLGAIVHWSGDAIVQESQGLSRPQAGHIHIMTDAAGSLDREAAKRHGVTLLDSYIVMGDISRPESLVDPEELYALMRKGVKVTTAQASNFERNQLYHNVCKEFGSTLYLCVGSGFTGNYDAATAWQHENDQDNLLTVIDTGTASGRLGLTAALAARYAVHADSVEELCAYVRSILNSCREYVFINELQYLVAGGRLSKTKGFFGDLLQTKPIISPVDNEVRKIGVARSRKGQLDFIRQHLPESFQGSAPNRIMLQHTDNMGWIAGTVQPLVQDLAPEAEIMLMPLSLTSGVHMGPGSWSLAIASA